MNKSLTPWIVCVVVVLAVVIFEESRVAELKTEIVTLKEKASAPAVSLRENISSSSEDSRNPRERRVRYGERPKNDSELLGETFRQMIENPIGKAMIDAEKQGKALAIYQELLKELKLSDEEQQYFLGLVSTDLALEDSTGMKLFGAKSNDERLQILDEMDASKKKFKEDIAKFLNNDEDFERFEHYQDRKSEYEHLGSLRAAIAASGSPLTGDQEGQLIEAMYESRMESGITDKWEGRAGFEQFGQPGVADRFTKDWNEMQTTLDGKTGSILDDSQQNALNNQNKQFLDLTLIGLRMVEGMIQAAQDK